MSSNTPYARRYRLRKLEIGEISSVDSAANPHARVVIRKGYTPPHVERDNTMTISRLITKAEQLRADGQISDYTSALLHQTLALEAFPESPNVGVALAKFYGTARGKQLLHGSVSKNYDEIQKRSAVGDAFDYLKRSAGDGEDEGDRLATDYPPESRAQPGPIQQVSPTGEPMSDAAKELHMMAHELQHKMKRAGVEMSHDKCLEHVKMTDRGRLLTARDKHVSRMAGRHSAI